MKEHLLTVLVAALLGPQALAMNLDDVLVGPFPYDRFRPSDPFEITIEGTLGGVAAYQTYKNRPKGKAYEQRVLREEATRNSRIELSHANPEMGAKLDARDEAKRSLKTFQDELADANDYLHNGRTVQTGTTQIQVGKVTVHSPIYTTFYPVGKEKRDLEKRIRKLETNVIPRHQQFFDQAKQAAHDAERDLARRVEVKLTAVRMGQKIPAVAQADRRLRNRKIRFGAFGGTAAFLGVDLALRGYLRWNNRSGGVIPLASLAEHAYKVSTGDAEAISEHEDRIKREERSRRYRGR